MRAYYSTVFELPAEKLWSRVRDFGNYALWIDGGATDAMEPGRTGDSVGASRILASPDRRMVQRLTAHSDRGRWYSYSFAEGLPTHIVEYEARLRITPITDPGHAFVEWWADFTCRDAADQEHWRSTYESSFATWLHHLRVLCAGATPDPVGRR